jgi:putative flippase GtrA
MKKEKKMIIPPQTKFTKEENRVQAIKFLLFSISAGAIQVVTFTLLFEVIKFYWWPSYLIALTLSVLWNYTLNRKFTFKSANNIPVAMMKVALYYVIFTPTSTWGGDYLVKIGWNGYLVLFLAMVTNLITEFLYTKYYVYRNAINTAVKTNAE